MLALADWANDDGVCWPSIATLGKRTRKSRTRVYAALKELQDSGHLTVIGDGNYRLIEQSRKRDTPVPKTGSHLLTVREPSLPQAAQAAKPRARNPIWDALCQAVYGTQSPALTASETSDFAKTVKDLTAINATPEEILAFPKWWTATFPGAALTHRCFRLHFSRYRATVTKTTTRQLWQGDSRER